MNAHEALSDLFAAHFTKAQPDRVSIFLRKLREFGDAIIAQACARAIDNLDKMPSIARLREMCREIQAEHQRESRSAEPHIDRGDLQHLWPQHASSIMRARHMTYPDWQVQQMCEGTRPWPTEPCEITRRQAVFVERSAQILGAKHSSDLGWSYRIVNAEPEEQPMAQPIADALEAWQ